MMPAYAPREAVLAELATGPKSTAQLRVALNARPNNLVTTLRTLERQQQVAVRGKDEQTLTPGRKPTIWALLTPEERLQRDLDKARALLERHGFQVTRC